MTTSNEFWPQEWSLDLAPQRNFLSSDFIHISLLRADVDVYQSVCNKKLYVRKLVHRRVGEEDQREEDEDGFKGDNPPELRVSTCPQALARLPDEDYFPRLVGWQRLSETHWGIFTE